MDQERKAKLSELKWLKSKKDSELESLVSYTSLDLGRMKTPPWILPEDHENATIVNKILEESLKIQSSTIPDLKEFYSQTQFIVSHQCQNVSILLSHYLHTLGIQTQVMCGVVKLSQSGVPHVFLKFRDVIIDKSYSHDEIDKNPQENLDYFLKVLPEIRKIENYMEEIPTKSKLQLIGGDAGKIEWKYMEVGCETELNQKKMVAAVIENTMTNPGTWIYDKLMRSYLKKEFNIEVEPVQSEMSRCCWNCGQEKDNLKTCSGCKLAKYCDKNCISEDWETMHKLMHKMIAKGNDNTVNMLHR